MPAQPLNPFDYAERFNPARRPTREADDPITATLQSIQDEDTRRTIIDGDDPDTAAKVTRIAREANAAPALIEDRIGEVERAQRADRFSKVLGAYPAFGRWAASDPRGAVAASDDHESLGMLGRAWEGLKNVGGSLQAGYNQSASGLSDLYLSIDEAILPFTNPGNAREILELRRRDSQAYRDRAQEARPETDSFVARSLLQGVESTVTSMTGLAVGLITRSPNAAASTMGVMTGAPAYQEARGKGKGVGDALRYGIEQGAVEALTERLPAGAWLEALYKRTPFGATVLKQLEQELPGEQVATALQDLSEWINLNPDKPFSSYLEERPQAALATALATVSGTTAQVGAARVAQRTGDAGAKIADRVIQGQKARQTATFIDKASKAAEASKLRTRDPEAYRALVKSQAEETGATHVYVDAAAVQAYYQSDSYDPDGDPFAVYEDQANEAAATGGDVVIPIADALTDLVGTAGWEAIKPDMRLVAGGVSPREADTFDSEMENVLAGLTDDMAASEQADAGRRTALERLTDSLATKIAGGGYAAPAARTMATVLATRAQTRADRFGVELTGAEDTPLQVRSVDRTVTLDALADKGNDKAVTAQAVVNSAGLSAEDMANILEGSSLSPETQGVGSGPQFLAMLSEMGRAAAKDPQIFRRVVELVPVDVMNNLALTKRSAERLLRDKAMLKDAAALDTELAVSSGGDSADAVGLLLNEITRQAAKLTGVAGSAGRETAESGSAVVADVVRQFNDSMQGRAKVQFFGAFGSDLSTIQVTLFENKNLSSFWHETGHIWLEELRFDASLDGAPDQVRDDWAKVQDWFTANGHPLTSGQIPVEAHELWARGVERYLMEGKAPSSALTRIFETFRGWLTQIYRTVDALRSPITPEIRGVMDRLIATDEEIAAANERQNIAALFKQAADAAMSAQEFAAYQAQVAEARADAHGKLLDKTMRVVRARETKRWRDERETLLAETTEAMDATPLLKSLAAMKAQPISAEWLSGEGIDPATLPVRVPPIVKPGGADPQIIAELAGFATARDMLTALQTAQAAHREAKEGGDKRSLRARTIAQNTDAEMERRYGDPLNDGSIEREALEAAHSDMQGEVIATELRVLSRKSGKRATPYALAKDWARSRVRSGKVADEASPAAIQRYARAASKAGREAEAAMLKQDADEAFRQKQFQMLNNALVSEAKQAEDEVNAAVRRLSDIAAIKTRKSIDQDYLEQAQALLEDYDFRRRTNKELDERGRFEAWAEARRAEGFDVFTPDRLAPIGTNWKAMTVDQLVALDEAVKQIVHMGRHKQELLDGKERRDFDELVGEAVAGTDGIGTKPPSDLMEPGWWDSIKSKVASIDAALLKMETVFDWLDRGNSNGVFNRVVFRPLADAQDAARLRMADMLGQLNDALTAIPKPTLKRWSNKVTTDLLNRETGNPYVFTRDQLISLALNMGNRGNIDKLTGGYGWDEQAVRDTLAQELTAEEWTYVQSVWDIIDSLWPDIEAMERRLNGVAPDKVEATPVDTPFGQLRGGYFPVIYDPRKNYDAEANAAKAGNLFENIYTRATTPKGFTKARTKVERPIHLSLNVITRHVAEVIHDVTHREAIMQADKFLSDKRVMRAVDEALGPEIRQAFRPWLQRIANQWAYDRAGMAGLEGFLNKMRVNATVVGMGFRISTALVQAAGYTSSFEAVGERWVAPRIKDAVNPAAWRFVFEKSKEVEGRMQSLDRDIADAAKRAAGGANLSAVTQFAFHGIGYMDRLVVVPTWLGAYDKAQAAGMDEDDAIYAADKAVRQSQGSGAAKDLAAVQAGRGPAGALGKYLTMFYSFMSALYQRQRTLARDVRSAGTRDVPRLIARAWWMIVAGPVLAELLSGRWPEDDDDETWTAWATELIARQFIGPIPLARDVVPVLVSKVKDEPTFGYRFTPAQSGLETLIRVGEDAERIAEGEETKRATRNLIELIGYTTGNGLFTGQIASAAQFMVDVGSGDADPEGAADWYEGLTKGKIKDD